MASSATIANITKRLEREINLNTITPLQKAQYAIQKNWLEQELGHVEMILNPGATRVRHTTPQTLAHRNPVNFCRIFRI
jgi:hypothetical protein